MSPRPFLLGDWRIEPSLNQVLRGSSSQRVTPKAMKVLVLLASRSGDMVSREELLDGVWSDVNVNEEVLTRAVADLRKAFDDDPRAPRYIATIPKRGYRLVAPVASVASAPSVPSVAAEGLARQAHRPTLVWGGVVALLVVGVLTWAFRDPGHRELRPIETRPLTSLSGREVLPALSPDGSRVAFSWSGESGENWDIYVKLLDSEKVLRLTEDPGVDASAAWSPDGHRIAFERYEDGQPCRIREVDALGGGERELGSCGESQNPDVAWSPDGNWLAFSDRDDPSQSFGIYLLSTSTGERKKLVSPDGQHWGDKDPSFSPDGKWVSFTRGVSMNTQDVFRIRVEGGAPERVTFDGREVRGHAFTSDGRSLVVSSARNGHLALWRFPLEGGTPQWLVFSDSSGGVPRSPAIGPSEELVFEDRTTDSDIASVSLDRVDEDDEPATLVSSTREEEEPALSPKGDELAFVSTRSGSPEIWVSGTSGENPIRLTDFRGPHVGSPSWSPDGARIAFDARPEGHADVFWVEASGSGRAPRQVSFETANSLLPSFSRDGTEIFFGSDRSGTWQIWKVSADGHGTAECVTRDGGYAARISPDGRALFFTRYDRSGIFRLDLASGDEAAVTGTEKLQDPSLWGVLEGQGKKPKVQIVFVAFESMSPHLFRVDLGSGGVRDLGPLGAQAGGGLSIDGNHDRVLFTRTVRTESDLVLAALR
jgi:Tol biopolymer transport system component/DNA-binding winged helix-turn-helix (wHTH) protein